MKTKQTIVAALVLIVSLGFFAAANADTVQEQTNPPTGHHWNHMKNRSGLLERYVRQNMAVQAVSDLAKVPVDTIHQKLQEERLPAVLQEYNIDRAAFASAMHAKVNGLMGILVENNYLTAEQQSQILTRMDQRAQRRELFLQQPLCR